MKRGDIWTAAGGHEYAGKPRPVVILQDEVFEATDSITICPISTDNAESPLFRPSFAPDLANGLRRPCKAMADKITTVRKSKVGIRIGRLDDGDMSRLSHAVILFLGLAPSPRRKHPTAGAAPLTKPPASPTDRA